MTLCCVQAQEELEILYYSPPIVVHQDHSSHHQAVHQVNMSADPLRLLETDIQSATAIETLLMNNEQIFNKIHTF